MARRRGKTLKVKLRDIDRGYRKLLKRVGAKAKKARRGVTRAVKGGRNIAKGIFKEAAAEIARLQKKKPTARQMAALSVTVGIHAEEGAATHEGEAATVAEIGTFHEFGFGVPQRSFIRAWADENEALNKKRLRKIAEAVKSGHISSPRTGLNRFGILAVGEIQERIANGIEPELAESTIRQKGSTVPLIDTGVLRSSITHRVGKAGASSDGEGSEGE